MNIVLESLLKIIFGKELGGKHRVADFNRVYFSNRNPEIKTNEDMLEYILNFVGYYNLYLSFSRLEDFGIVDFIQKKHADGSLLSVSDLNKMYGINNSGKLLEHVERGVITCYGVYDKRNAYSRISHDYGWSMFLQTKHKPLFYQALLRERLNEKIYKMTDTKPWKHNSNIKLRTTNDFMPYILDCCISCSLVIYNRPKSADFMNYIDQLHKKGLLLSGPDIEKRMGLPIDGKITGTDFGQTLLNQYWVSGSRKSIAFMRGEKAYSYLPVENFDDFVKWTQSADNKMFCLTDKDLALKIFFGERALKPENIAAFERAHPTPAKNNIPQVIDYCIDYASFHNLILQDFRISPYSLSTVIEEKRQSGELLTATDITRVTGINKYVPTLLKSFGKSHPHGILRFSDSEYCTPKYLLRANMLDSFVAGVGQYQFITSFAKLPDLFKEALQQIQEKQSESLALQYINGKFLDVVDLEAAFPGCTINMKRALREFDSLCPNTVIDGRYLPVDKVDDFKRIMRIGFAKKQPTQKNDDVYSLTDRQMDAVATALAQKNYQSERNAARELFDYLERGYFHKQK